MVKQILSGHVVLFVVVRLSGALISWFVRLPSRRLLNSCSYSMVHQLVAVLTLWAVYPDCQAIRTGYDGTQERSCVPATPRTEQPGSFALDYQHARNVDTMQRWSLKTTMACDGEEACQVALTPEIDPDQPLRRSRLLINVYANCSLHGQELFLCSRGSPCVVPAPAFPSFSDRAFCVHVRSLAPHGEAL